MYHTSTKHMHQQAYMQSAHVGPTRARKATSAHLLLLDRCDHYGDDTYHILYIQYIYVSRINITYIYVCNLLMWVPHGQRWLLLLHSWIGATSMYIFIYTLLKIYTHTHAPHVCTCGLFVFSFFSCFWIGATHMYTCMIQNTHTHTRTHTHTHLSVGQKRNRHIRIVICVYVYMCICVYVYMCICVYVWILICVYVLLLISCSWVGATSTCGVHTIFIYIWGGYD